MPSGTTNLVSILEIERYLRCLLSLRITDWIASLIRGRWQAKVTPEDTAACRSASYNLTNSGWSRGITSTGLDGSGCSQCNQITQDYILPLMWCTKCSPRSCENWESSLATLDSSPELSQRICCSASWSRMFGWLGWSGIFLKPFDVIMAMNGVMNGWFLTGKGWGETIGRCRVLSAPSTRNKIPWLRDSTSATRSNNIYTVYTCLYMSIQYIIKHNQTLSILI